MTTSAPAKPPLIWIKEIIFPNGHVAPAFKVSPHTDPAMLIQKLPLASLEGLIMLSGGAGKLDASFQPRLMSLFEQGVVPFAAKLGLGFISGGTSPGVMTILGDCVAAHGYHSPLIGVAPSGPVNYPGKPSYEQQSQPPAILEPHHTHFVLVNARHWGGEVDVMYGLAAQLVDKMPMLTLLVNGGAFSKTEVLYSVRLKIPVLIIAGSGRLADQLASLVAPTMFDTAQQRELKTDDPVLTEILRDGQLIIFPATGTKKQLVKLLYQQLGQPTGLLGRVRRWLGQRCRLDFSSNRARHT